MRRKVCALILICFFILTSCQKSEDKAVLKKYEASFLTLFDTVTTMVGYAESEEVFSDVVNSIHKELLEYHQLYNIYNDYAGINNVKTINDNAGIAPVVVDRKIIDLLLFCKDIYYKTGGKVNVAMGSVLSIWHDYRQEAINDPSSASIPDIDRLAEAAKHTDIEDIVIDEASSTVYLADPLMSLDVGAIAKGYATECVTKNLDTHLLISVGGNVSSSMPKPEGKDWVVGLQDPFSQMGEYNHTIKIQNGAVVTSGDYQRYYVVGGVKYHHIIDPETLMPASLWIAVSVVADDSALADALSTALFLMDQKDGQKLLDEYGAYAIWTDISGEEFLSSGFEKVMRS